MLHALLLPQPIVSHRQSCWVDELCFRSPKRLRQAPLPQRSALLAHHSRCHGRPWTIGPCMTATELHPTAQAAVMDSEQTLICTIVTADTMPGALEEIKRAAEAGADVIELRADYLTSFEPENDVKQLLDACAAVQLPAIFTYRPAWEGCARRRPSVLVLAAA